MGSETPLQIPVIHLSKENLKPGTGEWESVCNDARRAFEEYGCFEAVYDDFTLELHNAIMGALDDLFNLPIENRQKNESDQKPYPGYEGTPDYENMGIVNATALEAIQHFSNLMWPEGNPSFSEVMHAYNTRISELDKFVKKIIFQSLGIDRYYNPHVEASHYICRIIKYNAPKTNEPQLSAGSHTDINCVTILHQNQVNGLEVQTRSGEWVLFTPSVPTSFIVISGDSFHAMSNGRFHSPEHRVMMSGDEVRYVIGLFSFSKEKIECPEELVDEQHPLLFKPFDHVGLLNHFLSDLGLKSESAAVKSFAGV